MSEEKQMVPPRIAVDADAATQKSAAFTPGPWAAFTDDSGSVAHTNIVAVVPRTDCVFSLPGHHKSEPNVRLIESAPDLFAFAEWFDADMSNQWSGGPNGHPATLDEETAQAWRRCRALIRRVAGDGASSASTTDAGQASGTDQNA